MISSVVIVGIVVEIAIVVKIVIVVVAIVVKIVVVVVILSLETTLVPHVVIAIAHADVAMRAAAETTLSVAAKSS